HISIINSFLSITEWIVSLINKIKTPFWIIQNGVINDMLFMKEFPHYFRIEWLRFCFHHKSSHFQNVMAFSDRLLLFNSISQHKLECNQPFSLIILSGQRKR